MTMRLTGVGAFCDLCGLTFLPCEDCPKGTIKHVHYDGSPDCPDANKVFELPPLTEIPKEKGCTKR
jgi:hypothetical protein